MSKDWKDEFLGKLGAESILLDEESRNRLSKDYYWYSPILEKKLAPMTADGIVIPNNIEELIEAVKLAVEYKLPITIRGAGTGNYGQCIPLQGGIVLDMSRLKEMIEIVPGSARVQAGVKLGLLESTLRKSGQQMCIYPSTFVKSTAAGFISGGSAGIGSIEWGFLWDGNVIEITVLTVEEEPKLLKVSGKQNLLNYIHAYGTTGIITEVVYRTTNRTEYIQVMLSFDETVDALSFANEIAYKKNIGKRLISQAQWPLPSFFLPLAKYVVPEKDVVFLEVNEESLADIESIAAQYHGSISHIIPASNYQKGITFSDYTWNHATLWGMKAKPQTTYLQCEYHQKDFLEQIKLVKERFQDDYLLHFEFLSNDGQVTPQCIPLIQFRSEEELTEMVNFLHAVGVQTFDPHTYILEEGGWTEHIDAVIATKRLNDPYGLLNPGKIGKLGNSLG